MCCLFDFCPAQTSKSDVYGLLLPGKQKTPVTRKRTAEEVVKKRAHRKSSLISDSTSAGSSMEDANVKLLSVSPKHDSNIVETKQGRLSELVKQFEGLDSVDGVDNVNREGIDSVNHEGVESVKHDDVKPVKKRKPSNKAFEMFEKQGVMIGMVGPI